MSDKPKDFNGLATNDIGRDMRDFLVAQLERYKRDLVHDYTMKGDNGAKITRDYHIDLLESIERALYVSFHHLCLNMAVKPGGRDVDEPLADQLTKAFGDDLRQVIGRHLDLLKKIAQATDKENGDALGETGELRGEN